MGRGTGKGKGRGGGGRGGGRRMMIDNIEEMQMRESAFEESRKARAQRRGESDSEDEDDAAAAPAAETEADEAARAAAIEKMAAARAAAAAAAPAPEDEETVFRMSSMGISKNPNAKKGRSEFSVKGLDDAEVVDQEAIMSRKEREALEAVRKKEEYMRRHLAGETEAAKADLARLAEVRKRRADMEKQRLAEGRGVGMTAHGIEESSDESDSDVEDGNADAKPKAKAAPAAAAPAMSERESKKRAVALGVVASDETAKADEGPPKLKAMDIKKMNGDALKDACKERDLKIQGQKKELMQRLLDYEAARA